MSGVTLTCVHPSGHQPLRWPETEGEPGPSVVQRRWRLPAGRPAVCGGRPRCQTHLRQPHRSGGSVKGEGNKGLLTGRKKPSKSKVEHRYDLYTWWRFAVQSQSFQPFQPLTQTQVPYLLTLVFLWDTFMKMCCITCRITYSPQVRFGFLFNFHL